MIRTEKRFSSAGFSVGLFYDDFCSLYCVRVVYNQSGGTFFSRDYKTKGSAIRSYNSWVSKLSAVDERFSNVK